MRQVGAKRWRWPPMAREGLSSGKQEKRLKDLNQQRARHTTLEVTARGNTTPTRPAGQAASMSAVPPRSETSPRKKLGFGLGCSGRADGPENGGSRACGLATMTRQLKGEELTGSTQRKLVSTHICATLEE